MLSAGDLSPKSEGLHSSNMPDLNELMKLVSSCGVSEPTQTTSFNSWQEFNGSQGALLNTSLTDSQLDYKLWLNNIDVQNTYGASIKQPTTSWPPQTRKPVTRSHSAATGGDANVLMTSLQNPTSSNTSSGRLAAVGSELKSQQHRGLARTTSDPIPARARSAKNSASVLLSTSGGETSQAQSEASDRYKTELCRTFQDSGKCKYGEKCQFAHGKGELRTVTRHPKYKTDRCKTYHSTGFCPYGPRCHFVHDENELSAEVEKRSETLKLFEEQQQLLLLRKQYQQQLLQKQQQQYHQQLLLQKQQQLLLALFCTQQQIKQGQCSSDFTTFGNVTSPIESLTSTLPSLNSPPRKYSDSLGSVGTNSPPLSVTESPSPSPSLLMADEEQLPVCAQRSGSVDYSSLLSQSQEFSELLPSPLQMKSEDQLSWSFDKLFRHPATISQFLNGAGQSLCNNVNNLSTAEFLQSCIADRKSENLTVDDIIRVAEVLKCLPVTKCNQHIDFNSSPSLTNITIDPITDWQYPPPSGLVL